MEAVATLPFSRVRTFNGELLIDGLRVDDETAVALVREREERGESVDRLVVQMVEVGARVLEREHTGAQADVVKAEFERLKADFGERLNRVFGAEEGHVARLLDKHFGDESSAAVQHRMRAVMNELAVQMREDLRKQLTTDTESNPIVAIQRASLQVVRDTANQQAASLEAMNARLEAMRLEVAALKAEKEKLAEVAAEAERGTAKGRTYEESVFDALDGVAGAQGDDCDAVGDVMGVGGRKGDVVVAIDACGGPARGRIVFEAKNSRVPKKQALADLDEAMRARDADYGVFVVPSEDKLPARTPELREFNGNKMFVVFDAEDGARTGLELAYKLARARVLMARSSASGIDAAAIATEAERALGAVEDVRRVKSQLTQAKSSIDQAQAIVGALADSVRAHLGQIEALLREGEGEDDEAG
ncbi:MAG TPA: hypothetical protein VGW75_03430 [Solirubrobacteraceae bacterium]|jgi:hypothetical protein|nr:hypothetical protein [Solirubrobacteraceae bacterium]